MRRPVRREFALKKYESKKQNGLFFENFSDLLASQKYPPTQKFNAHYRIRQTIGHNDSPRLRHLLIVWRHFLDIAYLKKLYMIDIMMRMFFVTWTSVYFFFIFFRKKNIKHARKFEINIIFKMRSIIMKMAEMKEGVGILSGSRHLLNF